MTEFTLLRDRMVAEQIEPRGVTDARVLQAMRQVPRERFVDPDHADHAYEDRPLPIAEGQTLSQPFIVALMAQAAQIKPTDRVLEIGSGSGYGAAVLSELAMRVWSIERHPRLARMAGSRIAELGRANVTVLRADGSQGGPWRRPSTPSSSPLAGLWSPSP
jgi:protein-L-isoaspartate(D-aspartate) O-methyltransferase